MLRATCSRCVAALGVSLASAGACAQSPWDAPAQQTATGNGRYERADYEVDAAPRAEVWDGVRSAWTPVDAQGRTVRTERASASQSPAHAVRTVHTPAEQPRFIPLPEAIIRRSLETTIAPPMTAGSILRSPWVEPSPPPTAAGYARLAVPVTNLPAETQYFPEDSVEPVAPYDHSSIAAEPTAAFDTAPATQLFNGPEEQALSLFETSAPPAQSWSDAYAVSEGVGRGVLLMPAAAPHGTDPQAEEEAVVILDGLDAVATDAQPTHNAYIPTPLSQIRPYRSYSPEGIKLCPDPSARCPEVKALPGSLDAQMREMCHLDFLWVPANVFYSPLYFEDPALERYGHTHGPLLQPFASTGRFAAQLVGLPYQMALDPPHRRVYPLGFFRPGECAPKQVPNVPLNARAAAEAGAVYTGLIFAFP